MILWKGILSMALFHLKLLTVSFHSHASELSLGLIPNKHYSFLITNY